MVNKNKVVLGPEPYRGVFVEGTIKTGETPKPGQVVQYDVSAGMDGNGRWDWEIYNADEDGARPKGPLIILREDVLQGKLISTAYAAGDHAYGYIPVPGDELVMLLKNLAGTADDHTTGEMLIVDDTTGKLIATTGTPETEPFILLEDVTDPTEDTLVHVQFTGY